MPAFLTRFLGPAFRVLVCCSALPLLLANCASSLRQSIPPNSARIRIKMVGNLPFVNVIIAGKRYEFLVDTGASDCVITEELAKELNLPVSKQKAMVKTAAGDHIPIPMTLVPSMQIGPASFHQLPAFVYDFENIRRVFGPMDGVVGFSIFAGATLTLDYPRREMIISPGSTLKSNDVATMPMKIDSGVPRIPLRGGSKTIFIDVDSGSTGGLEVNPAKAGVTIIGPVRPGGISTSIGRTYRTGVARVEGSLFLGKVELLHPIIEVTDGDARVGGEVLQHTLVSFDQPSGLARMHFGEGEKLLIFDAEPKLMSPSRIGTGIGFDRSWVVQDVVPGSVAFQTGVRVGDRATIIQGQPVENLVNGAYQKLMQENEVLEYRFLREGKSFDLSVPVTMQVR